MSISKSGKNRRSFRRVFVKYCTVSSGLLGTIMSSWIPVVVILMTLFRMETLSHEYCNKCSKPFDTMMTIDRERHIRYFVGCLSRALPGQYASLDTNRLTLVHFCVHALDMLGFWDDPTGSAAAVDRQSIIEWIYTLQATPENGGGFQGGSYLLIEKRIGDNGTSNQEQMLKKETDNDNNQNSAYSSCQDCHTGSLYQYGHIAMTYTALCTLRTLGDDLSRVDTKSILELLLPQLQSPVDGSFQCIPVGSEQDLRFVYCACAICHMLQDWSHLQQDAAVSFILQCKSWDGALALLPGQEGHGGSTFCGIAALVLMNRLDEVMAQQPTWRPQLIEWCVKRQIGGMQGRPNKVEDTCYSYWIGGTLRLLGYDHLLQHDALQQFVASCQSPMGGFSKVRGAFPDLLHSFYSLAYFSLSTNPNPKLRDAVNYDETENVNSTITSSTPEEGEFRLKPLNCTLGICQERAALFGHVFFP